MGLFNVIILAGGEKGPLYEPTGYSQKALIPIHGKPMVSRVIDAFEGCKLVDQIVVVGSSDLDALDSMAKVRKRVFTGVNLIQNIMHAIVYIKHRVHGVGKKHNGYIITFCDAVFLTPEIINDTLQRIADSQGDLVLHYVEKQSFAEAGLDADRTYIPVAGQHFTGSTIYYVRQFKHLLRLLPKVARLRKLRKQPEKMLQSIGCEGMTLEEIQNRLSDDLGIRVVIGVSPYPELGMDVDKLSDLKLAQKLLE